VHCPKILTEYVAACDEERDGDTHFGSVLPVAAQPGDADGGDYEERKQNVTEWTNCRPQVNCNHEKRNCESTRQRELRTTLANFIGHRTIFLADVLYAFCARAIQC
jgi:hypothetical protein